MLLQKLKHNGYDFMGIEGEVVIVHGVNEVELGGEYTICGRSIPDSVLECEGWQAVGSSFRGSIGKCECRSCQRIIAYFKRLR